IERAGRNFRLTSSSLMWPHERVSTDSSAIPRHALVSLLIQAERALAGGDAARAATLLDELHWFGHGEPQLHEAVHRRALAIARARGDRLGALGQLLPIAFARAVSLVESKGPSFEVVQAIDAPPELVYRVLTDVGSYAAWNPWVVRATLHSARHA